MEPFKAILTKYDYFQIAMEGYECNGNPYVFLKPLKNIWEVFNHVYNGRNTVIVDGSKENIVVTMK